MYTLVLSYHATKPIIASEFELSKIKLIGQHGNAFKSFELTKGDRAHCIDAWERVATACEKQYKYHNLN